MKQLLNAQIQGNFKGITFCLIFFLVILLVPSPSVAQGMPVYDNTNFVSLVKQLAESGKQTSNLIKTVNFLKEQRDNLEKVNNVVKQLNAVREINKNNQQLISVVNVELRNILSSPYIKPDEIDKVTESFNTIVDNSLETLYFIEEILTSNHLKMTDADRALILKEKEMESREMVSDIIVRTNRYKEIISFREMQDKINNRETVY